MSLLPAILGGTLVAQLAFGTVSELHRPSLDLLVSTGLAVVVSGMITMSATFIALVPDFPRKVLALGLVFQFLFLSFWKTMVAARDKRWFYSRRYVVVCNDPSQGERFVERALARFAQKPQVLSLDELLQRKESPHDLVIGTGDLDPMQRERLVQWAAATGTELLLVPNVVEVLVHRSPVIRFADVPMMAIGKTTISPEVAAVKRAIDLVGAAFLLLLSLPILIVAALAIKLTSPGPVLFVQERVGLHGRPFRVYKLRTMIDNAEALTGPTLATEDDPRVTPVGRVLRATRLDELPQLWNVIKGEMSLVGPRPEREFFCEQISKQHPEFRLRQGVKPGLTGLAQVFGRYDTDPADKLRYDLMYASQYSLLLDLQIILWTIQAVLFPQSWMDKQGDRITALELRLLLGREAERSVAPTSED